MRSLRRFLESETSRSIKRVSVYLEDATSTLSNMREVGLNGVVFKVRIDPSSWSGVDFSPVEEAVDEEGPDLGATVSKAVQLFRRLNQQVGLTKDQVGVKAILSKTVSFSVPVEYWEKFLAE